MNTPKFIAATKSAMVKAGADKEAVARLSDEAVFNGFSASLPKQYARSIDKATAGFTNLVSIGQQILADEDVANAWISNLINRIGLVLFDTIELENPLRVFKKGLMPNGKLIEELAVDAATGYRFNPQIAETELFKRVKPKVATLVHTADRAMTYPATFQDQYLNDAFTSFEQLDQFVTGQIESMINGNLDDEYYATKLLISEAAAQGAVAKIEYDPSDIKNVQKAILAAAAEMNINNRNYNFAFGVGQAGIKTRTKPEDLIVIMDVQTKIDLDIDFWAQVFQADRAEANLRMIIIDKFEDVYKYPVDHAVTQADIDGDFVDAREFPVGSTILAGAFAKAGAPDAVKVFDASNTHFWLGDKAAIQIWDRKLPKIKTTENPMGMYVQAFLQVREVISYSTIAQSVLGVAKASA